MSQRELILFRLTEEEANLLVDQKGQGGFQELFAADVTKFNPETRELRLNDEDLGMIVRHLSYGSGGFQSVLKSIFGRSLSNLQSGKREK
ncbi:MAG: hypothetical protein LKH33_10215 [Acetobacter sp.]|jgi:hypothetical protein|nr:hypothetical protein [Acetobacter sp.]MCH4060514.1 hypothetical protein [Acetobacter sp.]MCH4087454.1 hypothetical protein [Acetobacter sp.]MCI1294655.1 hypothetical protein [Acetobacter sp.]MCI1321196.1 hypothetical protein [Acetobacter sp.]